MNNTPAPSSISNTNATDGDVESEGDELDDHPDVMRGVKGVKPPHHKRTPSDVDKPTPDRESLHIDDADTPNAMSSSKSGPGWARGPWVVIFKLMQ